MKKIIIWYSVFGLLAVMMLAVGLFINSHISNIKSQFAKELPDPVVIDLSYFTGRILPADEVHPGTFSISVPPEKINGENAIASYGVYEISQIPIPAKPSYRWVEITFWKPDGKASGIFETGVIHKRELWGPTVTIKNMSLDGKFLKIYPKSDKQFMENKLFFPTLFRDASFLVSFVFCLAIIIIATSRK